MGVYDYKNFGTADSKVLFSDAMAITLYSYHNLDNGFAAGYQHNGFGLGLPATLVTALIGGTDSQGVIPGVPWNPDSEKLALEAVKKAGWTPITASQLGYDGKTDAREPSMARKPGTPVLRSRSSASTMPKVTSPNLALPFAVPAARGKSRSATPSAT